MIPPRIELGFCPRQGHVLTIGLRDQRSRLARPEYLNIVFSFFGYG